MATVEQYLTTVIKIKMFVLLFTYFNKILMNIPIISDQQVVVHRVNE